ncbi:MAG: N-acetyl-gamma-glutamyl-phosphate reductase [Candidatus Promineifilaceae bacterium]|nr:N-acetyl-gamma-glutamyl-phosphate reductase [Candidatus Promineifilaceae bacterium]
MIRAAIVGGSGYVGGELLRLLLDHPRVEVAQVTSRRWARKYVSGVHPNLRGRTTLQFSDPEALEACDLLFLALPHGQAATNIERYAERGRRIIDLSSDFRLRDEAAYQQWYGRSHPNPAWLSRFVYGLPELYRAELQGTRFVSGVGCNATAVNLALFPLARAGLIERAVIEVKVGSSEGGASYSLASHHPERSGAVRSFAPTGHRHQAEMRHVLGQVELHFSATAVELIRGVLCTAHVFLGQDLAERDVWQLYRAAFRDEPFLRIVKDRSGVYRYPEPKILAGSNYCDVGFERDAHSRRLVVISALDNLMKGAAGTAVQAMNVMLGWPETTGLTFPGLHPI